MRRFKLSAALSVGLLFPLLGKGAPLDINRVPADAKWVIHIDMDGARDTKTWDAVGSALFGNEKFRNDMDNLEQITGMKFPDDLHDATVYGRAVGDDAGVVIIHAKIDRKQTMQSVKMNPGYTSQAFGDYQLLTWDDNGKTRHGAFHDDTTLVVGADEENIKSALDVIDGKAERIKSASPLATGLKPADKSKLMLYIAVTDVQNLHEKGADVSPLIESVKSGWLAVTETDGAPNIHVDVLTKDADSAAQLGESAKGLRAMLSMAANGRNADPVAKLIAAASKSATVTPKDSSAVLDWPMTIEQLTSIVDAVGKKNAGK